MAHPLLEVRNLSIAVFDAERAARGEDQQLLDRAADRALGSGWCRAVQDVSFSIDPGEVLAIVGESGCGKSLTVSGAFGLLASGAKTLDGSVTLNGHRLDLVASPEERGRANTFKERRKQRRRARRFMGESLDDEWRSLMANHVGVVFQNPLAGWSPVEAIGSQAGEVLEEHESLTDEEIEARVIDALGEVKLPGYARFAFAHELSRGQAQRAMLASALIKAPDLLIADEPLTGLDAPVAAAILDLIRDLRKKRGVAMLLVTHDLATVASIADRVAVMYSGRIIETGPVREIFHNPKHPYTEGLLGAIAHRGSGRLRPVKGSPIKIIDAPTAACAFAPRCSYRVDACVAALPPLESNGATHVRCVRHDELELRGV